MLHICNKLINLGTKTLMDLLENNGFVSDKQLYVRLVDGVMWITFGLQEMFLLAVWTLILTAPIHCRAGVGNFVPGGPVSCRV